MCVVSRLQTQVFVRPPMEHGERKQENSFPSRWVFRRTGRSTRIKTFCFQSILNDWWNGGARCSTVALIYAGNGLGRIEGKELGWLVDQLRDWASRCQVTLRLIDVVGASYLEWTGRSNRIIKKYIDRFFISTDTYIYNSSYLADLAHGPTVCCFQKSHAPGRAAAGRFTLCQACLRGCKIVLKLSKKRAALRISLICWLT